MIMNWLADLNLKNKGVKTIMKYEIGTNTKDSIFTQELIKKEEDIITRRSKSIVLVLDESDTQTAILVEIENSNGKPVRIGKRIKKKDGFTYLEIAIDDIKNIY